VPTAQVNALSAQDPLKTRSEPVMAQGANAASCRIRREPRRHQRAICVAPRACGRPYPIHDPARSAAQIARSSRTPLNCAAVAPGFRPRLGPRRCAMAPSAPNSPTLRLRSTSRVPNPDRSLAKHHRNGFYRVAFDREKMKQATAVSPIIPANGTALFGIDGGLKFRFLHPKEDPRQEHLAF